MNGNISHVLPSMRYIMKFAKIGLRAEGNSRGALLTTIFWDRTHVATAVIYRHPPLSSVWTRDIEICICNKMSSTGLEPNGGQNPFVSCKNLSVVRQIWPNQ